MAAISACIASRIEFAVGLGGAARLYRRTLAAVEHAELDAGTVGDPTHQPVERIDLAHKMALAEPADRRIARHRPDGRETVRHQRGARTGGRRSARRLATGMSAADDDYIVGSWSCACPWNGFANDAMMRLRQDSQMFHVKRTPGNKTPMFHVKHRPHLPMQNSEKITPRMSSTPLWPRIRPSDSAATRSRSARISSRFVQLRSTRQPATPANAVRTLSACRMRLGKAI